jgi:hypothetical protein
MDQEYYAHSLSGKPQKDWQRPVRGLSQDLRTESSEVVESGLSPATGCIWRGCGMTGGDTPRSFRIFAEENDTDMRYAKGVLL